MRWQLKQRGRSDGLGSDFEITVGGCWDLAALVGHEISFSSPGWLLDVIGLI